MTNGRKNYSRDESIAKRLDRNYNELLQELRVAQTGVQILFAFLLGIAFQQRFATISDFQKDVYVATLICSALATVMFIAPVAFHRLLFRRNVKDQLVTATSRLAATGLVFLGAAMLGAIMLVTDIAVGRGPAIIITAIMSALFVTFWLIVPAVFRNGTKAEDLDDGESVPEA